MTEIKKARWQKTEQEIIRQTKLKYVKKTESERRKIEQKVKELEKKTPSKEKLLALCSEYNENLPSNTVSLIEQMVQSPKNFVGKVIEHMWYNDEEQSGDGNVVCYIGHVVKLKRNKVCTYVIGYHLPSEPEDEADDYDMPRCQLISDIICGELALHV